MKTSVQSLHIEYTSWLEKLGFYKNELKLMQKQLEELLFKHHNTEVKFKAEHYQNLIFIEEQSINRLSHHLLTEDKKIQYYTKQYLSMPEQHLIDDHEADRHMIEFFENNFHVVKNDFNHFLIDWK